MESKIHFTWTLIFEMNIYWYQKSRFSWLMIPKYCIVIIIYWAGCGLETHDQFILSLYIFKLSIIADIIMYTCIFSCFFSSYDFPPPIVLLCIPTNIVKIIVAHMRYNIRNVLVYQINLEHTRATHFQHTYKHEKDKIHFTYLLNDSFLVYGHKIYSGCQILAYVCTSCMCTWK